MNTITKEFIIKLTYNEWERAVSLCQAYDLNPAHNLNGVVVDKLSCLGKANIKGEVIITSDFIGIDDFQLLIDIVRHEIAHLIAGIEEGHNAYWKSVCDIIGCEPKAQGGASEAMLEKAFKYRLIAVLRDGGEVVVDYKNRRSKKFLEPDERREYSINGKVISSFYYEETA